MTKKVVLIGDSITDAGRREDPNGIGTGYVKHLYEELFKNNKDWELINKGVSGDRVTDLEARWEEDVLKLNPDVLSISIGINDVWYQIDHPEMEQVTPDQFEAVYRSLLDKVPASTQLILMEPTIIEEHLGSLGNQGLVEYAEIVRFLAEEKGAILVQNYAVFMGTLANGNHPPLTTDGVHMTDAGSRLMADTWKKAAGYLFKTDK
ncbi:SGNH/GDSL hydrolase family protein [Jeotgalibacillus proteolyticus]|uniref:Hydrolase n=1 Tax=Jeotgalibacillus proteolyticus TaxID=2082395 RepID=A0A2S5GBK1_9BACL|nr:SGNH/GDSL hydrolase family protein [Jeotgalibacillus proteolyticus]PPA70369.1 hydrolase [Jeotgalibacillus proteolyticus]